MVPSYANFGGKVHGGTLMSLMDKVAYVCASKHAGNYCVTVSVDNVEFLQPVEVGEVIKLMGSVNYVGRKSLVVGIKVVAENLQEGVSKHTNTCYFTMVAKDADGNTAHVPPLILKTHDDVRRFLSALERMIDNATAAGDNVTSTVNVAVDGTRIDLPVTANNLSQVLLQLTEGQLLLTLSALFPKAPSTMTEEDAAALRDAHHRCHQHSAGGRAWMAGWLATCHDVMCSDEFINSQMCKYSTVGRK